MTRTKHLPGRVWPACTCRLCMDEHICPAAVTEVGRALVLAVVVGLAAVAVGSL